MGAFSRRSRASSTPPDAASISTTSRCWPSRTATHWSHEPQGSGVGPDSQLTILARIRAVEVLPVPRGPQSRNACARRPPEPRPTGPGSRGPARGPRRDPAGGTCGRATGRACRRPHPPPGAARPPRPARGSAGGSASLVVAAHPPSTAADSSASPAGSPVRCPRHPPGPAYGCFLPDLTGFAGWRRAGPDLRRPVPGATADPPGLGRGFSPAEADCGFRAPLAPRLARPPRRVYAGSTATESVRSPAHRQRHDPRQEQHPEDDAPEPARRRGDEIRARRRSTRRSRPGDPRALPTRRRA